MVTVAIVVPSMELSMSSPDLAAPGVCKRRSLRLQLYLVLPVVPLTVVTTSAGRWPLTATPWRLGPMGMGVAAVIVELSISSPVVARLGVWRRR